MLLESFSIKSIFSRMVMEDSDSPGKSWKSIYTKYVSIQRKKVKTVEFERALEALEALEEVSPTPCLSGQTDS